MFRVLTRSTTNFPHLIFDWLHLSHTPLDTKVQRTHLKVSLLKPSWRLWRILFPDCPQLNSSSNWNPQFHGNIGTWPSLLDKKNHLRLPTIHSNPKRLHEWSIFWTITSPRYHHDYKHGYSWKNFSGSNCVKRYKMKRKIFSPFFHPFLTAKILSIILVTIISLNDILISLSGFNNFQLHLLLPDSGLATHHSKANTREASVGRQESCFRQKSQQSEEKADPCPENKA